MWGQAPPVLLRGYFCAACDVFGKGDECWFCGSEKVNYGRPLPTGEMVWGGNVWSPGDETDSSAPAPVS